MVTKKEEQIIPASTFFFQTKKKKENVINPDNLSIKKHKLVEIATDAAKNVAYRNDSGSSKIHIREDIANMIISAKMNINILQSVLSCEYINVKIENDNISDFARIGLEINLNSKAGLHINSSFKNDDYFISPDLNNPFGIGYKLRVYGLCERIPYQNNTKYKILNEPLEIYNIKDSYGKEKPKITKIYKPVIDITKILEDYGFVQKPPEQEFFLNSNYTKSNWNIFYNVKNLKIGYNYNDLLLSLYDNNNEKIWMNSDKTWNGSKFI